MIWYLYILWRASLVAQTKESACNAGDLYSIPGLGRLPGEGNGYPLQYSSLENSMDRGAWQATVHEVEKNRTQIRILVASHRSTKCPLAYKRIVYLGNPLFERLWFLMVYYHFKYFYFTRHLLHILFWSLSFYDSFDFEIMQSIQN